MLKGLNSGKYGIQKLEQIILIQDILNVSQKRSVTTSRRCLAKVNLKRDKATIRVVDLHLLTCDDTEIKANFDYQSQKDNHNSHMVSNNILSVGKALDMLREKNSKASLESKRVSLNYYQANKIIHTLTKDNNISSEFYSG